MRVRRDEASLARYCLSEEERAYLEHGERFLRMFVAKESLAKADGRGIAGDIRAIPALPLDGAVSYNGIRYYRHSLEWNGYVLSVTQAREDFIIETKETEVEPCCSNNY